MRLAWWFVFGLSFASCRAPKTNTRWQADYQRLWAIAKLETNLGKWEEADSHYRECLELSQAHHDAKRMGLVQLPRFTVLCKLNRFEEAAQALDAAKHYRHLSNDSSLEAFILHDTGSLSEKTGHFEDAVEPLKQSLALFVKAKDNGQAANVRISLAWAYYQMGRFEEASAEYLAAQREARPQDQHLCLGHLGNIAYVKREFAKAAEYYRKAGEAAAGKNQEYLALWLANEAGARIELREWQPANESNDKSIAAQKGLKSSSSRELTVLNQARIAEHTQGPNAALSELQAFVIAAKEPAPKLDALAEIVRIDQQRGDATAARNAFESGLLLIDRQNTELQDLENKLSFQASVMKFNRAYVAGLMAQSRVEEAFEVAEAGRARMLRDSLNLPARPIEARSIAMYRDRARLTNAAYLAYWIAPERSFLWTINGAGLRSYSLPGESELRERVDRFQQAVQEQKASATEGAALFATLVKPASSQLRGLQNIVIVPDGSLYGLNFETLRQGTATGPYWIQSATISVAPSLGLMLSAAPEPPSTQRALLMGDATEWNRAFPHLLYAPEELAKIEACIKPLPSTRLSAAKATPAAYEQEAPKDYRYIHFATHATANRNAPLESAIILSQSSGRGLLTARDILRIPVHAELVSISACRSAGARTYAGEGLVGLAWAFLRSGAHSVVAGLWDVNDFSSPMIMSGLYDGLIHGKSGADALRDAKLEMLKPGSKYADPSHWGPFLLYRGAGYQHVPQSK